MTLSSSLSRQYVLAIFIVGGFFAGHLSAAAMVIQDDESATAAVDFNRDIKPLLSDRCFLCHGPDSSSRKAGFRLDDATSATSETKSGLVLIVPGDPDESELLRRIALPANDIDHMPPKNAHKPSLTAEEVQLIRAWIESGAEYEKHWAFVAPTKPAPPKDATNWSNNAIDQFLLKRMKENGLSPSRTASRAKLLRRVTFDLTGLPPTLDELADFQSDRDENSFEKVVDRLLSSPRYGEHMAKYWLDAVRYGDTHGLHLDNYREIWPYRDWVIRAFNDNMSWADFTTKQIAGDLLENPTNDDLIASGYNRMHVTTAEGGSIKEEVYVRNVVDRVSTTGSVFLGLSVGCAQCHDHKFDPISARDFYSMFAFFNNLEADPMDGNKKDHAPVISVPTEEFRMRVADVDTRIENLKTKINEPNPEFDKGFAEWRTQWTKKLAKRWSPAKLETAESTDGTTLEISTDGQTLSTSGENPTVDNYEITFQTDSQAITGLRLDVLLAENGLGGRAVNGNAVLSEIKAEIKAADGSTEFAPLTFAAANADYSQPEFPIAKAIDGIVDATNGWGIGGHLRKEPLTAVFPTVEPFGFKGGTIVRVELVFQTGFIQHAFQKLSISTTEDSELGKHHSSQWHKAGLFAAPDGKTAFDKDFGPETNLNLNATYTYQNLAKKDQDVKWTKEDYADASVHVFGDTEIGPTYLLREINSPDHRKLEVSLGSDDGLKVWLNGEATLSKDVPRGVAADQDFVTLKLKPGKNQLLMKIVNIGGATGFYYAEKATTTLSPDLTTQRLLGIEDKELSEKQRTELRAFYGQSSPVMNKFNQELKTLQDEKTRINNSQPTTLVMKERMEPKPAYLLKRGEYDDPDKDLGPIPRAVPSFLPPLPDGAPVDRMGFAQWLLADNHPLMMRVTVNRFWQQFMGAGIVTTSDDFGSQGTQPTHPELLDWLAVEFRESDWNVKDLVKSMVMSKAYRQDSTMTAEQIANDPKNQWLARGPRYRMDAEMLRDQALSISGLIHHQIGGPSVKPPQPLGLWKSVGYTSSNTANFKPDTGSEKVHRRSIYTFWKRTSPPPQMAVFDAPTREECVVSRERTNNPLQALLLLNDPQYFECARHLAERMTRNQADETVAAKAAWMFKVTTLRDATDQEIKVLAGVFENELAVFQKDLDAAKKLLMVGEKPIPENTDSAELAAWTTVANVVLNLDEIINKQ
jgi:hypothetical protein